LTFISNYTSIKATLVEIVADHRSQKVS